MSALNDIAEAVRTLDVPVLLAWGPADPVFSDLYLRDLLQRIPHADVHRYEGASHLVTEDAPEALPDIRRWVEALSRAAADRVDDAAATGPSRDAASRRSMLAALHERAADPLTAHQDAVVQVGSRSVSWSALDRVVTDLAAGLSDAGVRRGDRVALLIPPGADLAAALYACWRIGAVIVVADAGLGVVGLARALRGAWPDHVIAVERGLIAARVLRIGGRRFAAGPLPTARARRLGAEATLAELARRGRAAGVLPEPPDGEALAAVVFTSGATGPAKGVAYRHRQIEANRDALIRLYGIGPGDRLVAAFAPFALYGPAMGIASAVPDMDVTRPGSLTAVHLADAAAAVGATLVWASPASLRNVVSTGSHLDQTGRAALAHVRLLMSAGAPVPRALLHQVLELMPAAEAHTPYGMTEVLPVADIDLPGLDKAGDADGVCVGRPVDGAVVRISALDNSGAATGSLSDRADVTGEIVVRAPWAKDHYDRLWATESASTRDGDWHRTGDVGRLDHDGRLWIEGRLAHVVTTDHGPVTPVGVEQRVEVLPHVASAACVGVGPAGSQVVVVVVSMVDDSGKREVLAPSDLTSRVREAAGVDVAAVLVRDTLPVDIRHNSKIDRAELARWAAARLS